MSVIRLWRRVRRADRPVAPVVGAANVLLSSLLFLLAIGVLTEPVTGEQENAAEGLALRIFCCWLLGGLVLFAVLGMARTLLGHLVTLLLPPLLMTVALLAL
ncbi:hypothetical protein J7I94_23635 [Streptomyces sp. ISL-12]|uniref:hypothetical protein n=1 Tax=Streptomyces sp. ISL-12 TaxID=2819177 RepID=UPI001BE9C453|nr:hypothetical protein [Streptomyces sp. ISL-12]MBT2413521.1 hypothetical protein [Streptomyces sp. ISL-12]